LEATVEIGLKRDDDTPLYRQLRAELTRHISSGDLKPGSRLPSIRSLARRLGVSLITVVQAYDALAADGLVHAEVGRGTFAGGPAVPAIPHAKSADARYPSLSSEFEWQSSLPAHLRAPRIATAQSLLRRPSLRSDVLSLAGGTPDPTLFPVRTIGRLWHRAMAVEDPRFLQYGIPQGDQNLRAWIAGHCRTIGIAAGPEDILITSGTQQAIDLVARTLIGPGDYVLVESPTFPTALDLFESRSAHLLGVPVDTGGMRVDIAAALIERFRPRLLYTIPTAQNPTGVTMAEDRRRRLAVLARQHNLLVVEDDTCSEFVYEGGAPQAVKTHDVGGHVIFLKSFSKIVIPGLRVGCLVANGSIMARLVEAKSVMDRFTSPLVQRTLWRYLTAPQYQRDLEKARETYRKRRDMALEVLEVSMPAGVTWTRPEAGFNLWVNLPDSISASEAFEEALREGVACGLGDLFLPHPPPPAGLRMSFADKPEPILVEGIQRLARGIARLLAREPGRERESEFVTTV